MSKERIQYEDALIMTRFLAFAIDVVFVAILAVLSQFGALLENELIWKNVAPGLHLENPLWAIIWFIIELPLYYFLISGYTNGQTLGKIFTGIRVVTDNNESTQGAYTMHLKRFFLIRSGSKVVKEYDPGVKGLE